MNFVCLKEYKKVKLRDKEKIKTKILFFYFITCTCRLNVESIKPKKGVCLCAQEYISVYSLVSAVEPLLLEMIDSSF